jgi:hypothetical protein
MSPEGWIWAGVVASGVYHGVNPGMGWPLATAAGLSERSDAAVGRTILALAGGHFASMAVVLLPFAALADLIAWVRPLQLGASLLLIGLALWLLLVPRHPRFLTRISPRRIAVWSFAIGLVHGAGLMVLPLMLGLCTANGSAAMDSAPVPALGDMRVALAVALVHSIVMLVAAGGAAWLVYRVFGLKALTRAWFNLAKVWAASLGLAGLATAWAAF